MFERIKRFLGIGGYTNNMITGLQSIIDHPDIAMPASEYNRILENKNIYKSQFADIEYMNSNGDIQTRPFNSINMSKVIARKMSKLVYNEGCDIKLDDEAADEFWQKTFNDNKFRKFFGEELEAGYAIGGLALRPYFDASTETIKISYCRADTFFPLESNENEVSEAAIATSTQQVEGNITVYYTLLEFHEWRKDGYTIRNQLFRSELSGIVGDQVPLDTLEKYKELEPEVTMNGHFTRPLFVYIKLAGKNNINLSSPLSAGIIDNAKMQLINLNEIYDEFISEVKAAKRKIIASDAFMKVKYDKNGMLMPLFDDKTTVFQRLNGEDPHISEFAPELRSAEYIQSMDQILKTIEMETGFSAGTFSFDGESVKTATEIISENSETFSTRSDNVLIVTESLKNLVVTVLELGSFYEIYKGEHEYGIEINFDDGVFQSQEAKADYYGKLKTTGLISQRRAIQQVLGVSEKEAIEIVREINAEALGSDYSEVENKVVEEFNGGEE